MAGRSDRLHRDALRESEQRLRLAVSAAELGVFEWDAVADETRWENPKMYEIFGRTRKEGPLSREALYAEALLPEDRPMLEQAASEAMRGDGYIEVTCRIRRQDTGELRWVELAGGFEIDGDGSVRRLIGVVADVTDSKAAEEALRASEATLNAILDTLPVGLIIADANGRIVRDNAATRELWGVPPETESWEAYSDWVGWRPETGQRIQADEWAMSRALLRGEETRNELILNQRFGSGERRYFLNNVSPLRDADGRVAGGVAAMLDVTDRIVAEKELRELNLTLESRIAERTAELEHRTRQLQRLALELSRSEDRERRRLAEVLHDDLQQQLASLRFHLAILKGRTHDDPAQSTIAETLDTLLVEAIDTLRTLSHEISPAVLHQDDLADAFRWLAEEMRRRHGLDVRIVGEGISVESDALKSFLFRAGQELLFNVVKHARVGEARLRLRLWRGFLCLAVSDAGRGFDPETASDGAGFGLLSIRERIQLLGGRMRIHSGPGRGSRFLITVPNSPSSIPTRQRPVPGTDARLRAVTRTTPRKESVGRPLRVVVADDHEIVRQGLVGLLGEEFDLELVGEAANGREAVDLAYRLRPDVIVMDVSMPVMSGIEATRQIKAYVPETRIVGLSMFSDPEVAAQMRSAGADAFLSKTDPSDQLLSAIRAAGRG